MASITIRGLDEVVKTRLRVQAAVHGRSMEEEARDIVRCALNRQPDRHGDLATHITARFGPVNGVELEPLPHEAIREPPSFDE